ncbi:MAG TPA: hypothetical protein VN848_04580, partial [Gemmatimonadales bacterium]|nr:hypothetical protein [Gemmatimonadales bacterium]
MIDVKLLRAAPVEVRAALARRNDPAVLALLDELDLADRERRLLTGDLDRLNAERNEAARTDARRLKAEGALPDSVREERRALGARIAGLETELRGVEARLQAAAMLV